MWISKQENMYCLLVKTHTLYIRTFSELDGAHHSSVGSGTLLFTLWNNCLYKFVFGHVYKHMMLSF